MCNDRRVKCEIAEAVDISEERVRNILYEELWMRQVGAALVECDFQLIAQTTFTAIFGSIQEESEEFCGGFVTKDEAWVYNYTPEIKQMCVEAGGPAPKQLS